MIPSFIFCASKFVRVFGLQFMKIGLHQSFLRWLYVYIYVYISIIGKIESATDLLNTVHINIYRFQVVFLCFEVK